MSLALGILGLLGGFLGSAIFGGGKAKLETEKYDVQSQILKKQEADAKQKTKNLEAMGMAQIGRQKGRGSVSYLGTLLGGMG